MKLAQATSLLIGTLALSSHQLDAQAVSANPLRGAFSALSAAVITDDPDPVTGDSVLKVRLGGTTGVTLLPYPVPGPANVPNFNVDKLKQAVLAAIQAQLGGTPTFNGFIVDGISSRNDQIPVFFNEANGSFQVMNSNIWAATSVGVERGINGQPGSYLASVGDDVGLEVLSYYTDTAPVFGFLGGVVYLEESASDFDPAHVPASKQLMAYDSFIPQILWNEGAANEPFMPATEFVYFTLTKDSAAAIMAAFPNFRLDGRAIDGSTVFEAEWESTTRCWTNLRRLVDGEDLKYENEVDIDALGVAAISNTMANLPQSNIAAGRLLLTYSLTAETTPANEDQLMASAVVNLAGSTDRVRGTLRSRTGSKLSDRFKFSGSSDAKIVCHKDPEGGASALMVGLPQSTSIPVDMNLSVYRLTKAGPWTTLRAVLSSKALTSAMVIFQFDVFFSANSSTLNFTLPVVTNGPVNHFQIPLPAPVAATPSDVTIRVTAYTTNGQSESYPVKIKM